MGGKPSKQTPADKRLKANKPKVKNIIKKTQPTKGGKF